MKIILDAGHGLYTKGKQTPDGIKEWSLNSSVCNFIAEYLKGYDVQVYRTDDISGIRDVSLAARLRKTNSIKPDLFVSIHHNAMKGVFENHSGIEVYIHSLGSVIDRKVASMIAQKLSEYTGLKNRGVKKAFFYVLGCKKEIPAVLVEGGFMDSNIDYKIITTVNGQKLYAKAVAEVIIEFLRLKKGNAIVPEQLSKPSIPANPNFNSYKVKITADVLNVRSGAGTNHKINTKVYKNEIYTIVDEENGWGKLLSGAGWIYLDYTTRDINSSINPIKNNKFSVKVNKKRAMVRFKPNSKSPLAGSRELHYGDVFIATDIVKGENVNGNNLWYKSAKGNYVWSGGLSKI